MYAYVYFVCIVWFFPLYCWLGLLTCKNRLPYNLYCVGGDVKHCTIQSKTFRLAFFLITFGFSFLMYCENYMQSKYSPFVQSTENVLRYGVCEKSKWYGIELLRQLDETQLWLFAVYSVCLEWLTLCCLWREFFCVFFLDLFSSPRWWLWWWW